MATHVVVIAVDLESGSFSYSQPVVAARVDDTVVWNFNGGPFAIRFARLSPLTRGYMFGTGQLSAVVRPNMPLGRYKYLVAVSIHGKTFVDDPEIMILE